MPGLSAMAGGVLVEVAAKAVVEVEEVEEVRMRCDVRVDEIHGCTD